MKLTGKALGNSVTKEITITIILTKNCEDSSFSTINLPLTLQGPLNVIGTTIQNKAVGNPNNGFEFEPFTVNEDAIDIVNDPV